GEPSASPLIESTSRADAARSRQSISSARWPSWLVATASENRGGVGWEMPKAFAGRFTGQAFRFCFLGTWREATALNLIGRRPRRGGFLVSFRTSKQNSDLRSCSRTWSQFIGAQDGSLGA